MKKFIIFIFLIPLLAVEFPVIKEKKTLATTDILLIKEFKFEGNTVFSDSELKELLKEYLNKNIDSYKLQEARVLVTKYYIDNGYINSGAIIPEQNIKDGIITFKIVEGSVSNFEIKGNKYLKENYIKDRLTFSKLNQKLLNINDLQESLMLLKDNPVVENIDAKLSPSINKGEASLILDLKESKPYYGNLRFNNYKFPTVGSEYGEIELGHLSLTKNGDALGFKYGITKGARDYLLNYEVPINKNFSVEFSLNSSDSEVVTDYFKDLNIENRINSAKIMFLYELKELKNSLSFGLGVEKKSAKTYLFYEPFSFIEGIDDGKYSVSAVEFFTRYIKRDLNQVLATKSTLRVGGNFLGATKNDLGADSEFITWLGQLQYLKKLNFLKSEFFFKTNLFLTDNELLPSERFSIGGVMSVRGYRESEFSSDSGVNSSIELKIPVKKVLVIPFFDIGRGFNKSVKDTKTISSLGLGFNYSYKDFNFELYLANPLKDINHNDENNLQDDGVHFQITYNLF